MTIFDLKEVRGLAELIQLCMYYFCHCGKTVSLSDMNIPSDLSLYLEVSDRVEMVLYQLEFKCNIIHLLRK